jgi:hypothetical protein
LSGALNQLIIYFEKLNDDIPNKYGYRNGVGDLED